MSYFAAFLPPARIRSNTGCGLWILVPLGNEMFLQDLRTSFKDTQVMETHPFDALEVFTGPMYIVFLFWPSGSGSFRMGGNVLKWLVGLNLDVDKSHR